MLSGYSCKWPVSLSLFCLFPFCFRFWGLFGFGLLKVLLSVWVVLFCQQFFLFVKEGRSEGVIGDLVLGFGYLCEDFVEDVEDTQRTEYRRI